MASSAISSAVRSAANSKNFRSLALSVYFQHPELTSDKYEMLSRATAFLLSVDSPNLNDVGDDFSHLEQAEYRRKMQSFKREHGYTPASAGGKMMDMGWLEFLPREVRPNVHIVASSHVLSPFLWKEYYPHDWLQHITQENCKYQVEVYDKPGNSILELDILEGKKQQPFHHPEGRDVALAHFENEKEALQQLKHLGVEVLHLRSDTTQYEKGEPLSFEGYAVTDDPHARVPKPVKSEESQPKEGEEDLRVFYPHNETGNLAFYQQDRFFATTPHPLPEGVCGAPVLDQNGRCSGVVEGIVPVTHEDKRVAGAAAFLPHVVLGEFVEYVERGMLQAVMEPDMFQMVVTAKKTNSIGGGVYKLNDDGTYGAESDFDQAFNTMIKSMKKQCSKEEMDALKNVIEDEKEQIYKIMEKEKNADISEVTARVRARTLAIRDTIHKQFQKIQRDATDGKKK